MALTGFSPEHVILKYALHFCQAALSNAHSKSSANLAADTRKLLREKGTGRAHSPEL